MGVDLLLHKRCRVGGIYPTSNTEKGGIPTLQEGEIAINYSSGNEFLTFTNDVNQLVEFRPIDFIENKLQYVINIDNLYLTNDGFTELSVAYQNGRLLVFQYRNEAYLITNVKPKDDYNYICYSINYIEEDKLGYSTFELVKQDIGGYKIVVSLTEMKIPSDINTDNLLKQDDIIPNDYIDSLF